MPSYKRLLVTSAKGGVGKSTTAVGIASSFARQGKKSIIIDLDMTSRSLDLLLGASDRALFNIGDAVRLFSEFDDPCSDEIKSTLTALLDKLIIKSVCDLPGFDLITAACNGEVTPVSMKMTLTVLFDLLSDFGYEIIVCDAGGDFRIAECVSVLFDMVIITSEQSSTSIRSAEYASYALTRAGCAEMRLVICSFSLDSVKKEGRAGVIEIIDACSLKCLGVVPYDRRLARLQDSGKLPDGTTACAYMNIAKRLNGNNVPLFDMMPSLRRRIKSIL